MRRVIHSESAPCDIPSWVAARVMLPSAPRIATSVSRSVTRGDGINMDHGKRCDEEQDYGGGRFEVQPADARPIAETIAAVPQAPGSNRYQLG